MLPSIISKFHHFRSHRSILLSKLQILLLYHTSPHSNVQFPPRATSHPSQNHHPTPSFLVNPAPTHFEKSNFEPETVVETLNSYANDWKLALEFYNWVETECGFQHTAHTLNRIVDILGKFFEYEIAWNLIERKRINGCCLPDHTTFRVLFKRYVSAHLVKEAIDAFVRSNDYNLRDEISFSNLIDALCEYKHVIEAEELCFKKSWGDQFGQDLLCFNVENTKIYNIILRGWFKMQWWKKCREFWEEMDKRGVEKDMYSYSIYMDIQNKSGKPWKAVKLYKEMRKKGIQLDVVAYNTVIRAMGISEGVDVAVRLYKEMIELGCAPNVVTFNTILKLLCENGRYREAHRVLNLMTRKGCEPNIVTYHCFFTCLEKPREILRYFDRMLESGVQARMDTYVMLMRKFGRWGFLRPVLMLWDKMAEHGLSPDEFAYNALIDVLLQKGLVDMARKYDEEMFHKGLSPKPRAELQPKMDDQGSGNA
ncbi:pentatricopeptide repeat-containing protein At1g80550, mitochondrial [Salvia miltiorrhiza]|uniref:pentatricopeptide repeat-containing protein At1g80550, mitochondrial n=1 Tax=Salvia miltiorrhiza TaxID=226208 RepID=UPI0025AD8296|nr:pentatricopeptide repeat-containing protein At1g80550, mitochondrial [Salvia miltiorrhiza]